MLFIPAAIALFSMLFIAEDESLNAAPEVIYLCDKTIITLIENHFKIKPKNQ